MHLVVPTVSESKLVKEQIVVGFLKSTIKKIFLKPEYHFE